MTSLNNNKSPGEDDIQPELLKYGSEILIDKIGELFNGIFENHEDLDVNGGLLLPIPKPGKPKGPVKNLRPITLLNTIRKVLSTIALKRVRPKIETYLADTDQTKARQMLYGRIGGLQPK